MTENSLKKTDYLGIYHRMVLIRRFEERVNELYMKGLIPSTLHLYIGQEAVAVGVCANLKDSDYMLSTHRPHGHAIAKGVSIKSIMAELYGKADGCCKGKGGSMHVGDINVGMFPAIAIVGGNVPIAAGAALAQKMQKNGGVTVCFFGDGAANEGAWHEALNAAAIYDLPVVFVCENNLYAASTPFSMTFRVDNVADRACAYGMPGVVVDGNDVMAVAETCAEAVERARRGEGPTLVECKTYRQCGHSRSDPRGYRSKEEEQEWLKKDPIPRFERWLLEGKHASDTDLAQIREKIENEIDEAIAFAESSPLPDPATTYTDVFKE
ncbi:MAG: thiamine pyrophosphate-dependent dehydrogenase E1 component subunit alpha [Pelolinea sp.]|nr:thiamine pyrophosphate-dependent dehydrogenase E1 component subunit alpha [Pelolinea sp.]